MFLKSLRRRIRLVVGRRRRFEPGNTPRMNFETIGNKAEVKAAETAAALGTSDVTVVAVPEFVDPENVGRVILPGDYVLLCVDNHVTRRIVSEHCGTLSDVALFSGGNDGVVPPSQRGSYGNVQIAIRRGGRASEGPITQYHPEIAQAAGKLPSDQDCGQLALSLPQILFTNLSVASSMLNAFFAYSCGRLAYQEVQFDILDARWLPQFPLTPEQIPEVLPGPAE